jgi:indolepyruvate ferredoxin oxidoreductase beta subunit
VSDRLGILLAGVGGQGVLAAAQILGAAAHAEHVPVVVGQLHGMSQRGGTVQCTVLLGPGESSFLSGREADVVIALDALEALRALPSMGPSTRVVLSRSVLVPFESVLTAAKTPDAGDVVQKLREVCGEARAIDTRPILEGVGESRALNVLMIGAAAGLGLLPLSERALLDAIAERCGSKYFEANRKAFFMGRDATRAERASEADPGEARVP